MVVVLLLAVDLTDLVVDMALLLAAGTRLLSPKPRGADAELDKGGGEANKLCEVGGGAVTVYIWGVT